MRLEPVPFSSLAGFAADDLAAAFAVFRKSAAHHLAQGEILRAARPVDQLLRQIFATALAHTALDQKAARGFFEHYFLLYFY